jgi:hypothetical protein
MFSPIRSRCFMALAKKARARRHKASYQPSRRRASNTDRPSASLVSSSDQSLVISSSRCAVLAPSFTPRQDAALLAATLSLPNDGRYPMLELDPQQRRQKTLETLTAQLVALAQPSRC